MGKKITTYVLLFLSVVAITSSCKKDTVVGGIQKSLIWNTPVCEDADTVIAPTVTGIFETGSQFKFPVFNPNNSNEIVYFEQEAPSPNDHPSAEAKLIKYNIQTGTKTVLVTSLTPWTPPVWNEDGWIAYETQTSIYIVQADGTNQTQFVIASGVDRHLSWKNGSNTLLWKSVNEATGDNYLLQKTIGQQDIDTLFHGNFGRFSISNTNQLFTTRGQFLQTMDLNQSPLTLNDFSSSLAGVFYHGLTWHPNADKIYISKIGNADTYGLFEVDFATGTATRLVEYCHSWVYAHIAISQNGNRLVIQKINSNYDGTIQKSSIWLLDLTTLEEAKLPL